jgi:hypothetical protein
LFTLLLALGWAAASRAAQALSRHTSLASSAPPVLWIAKSSRLDAKCGYIDKQGKAVVALQFDDCRDFSDGLAAVKVGEKWGFIDASGKFGIEPRFEMERRVINKSRTELRPTFGDFHEGLAAVAVSGKWGYMNETGATAIEPRFEAAGPFSEDLAAVRLGDKFGYINGQGVLVIPAEYEEVREFSDGMAAVRAGGHWGYIDKSGKVVIAPRFTEKTESRTYAGIKVDVVLYDFSDFHEGLAAVKVGEKWGYIDKEGKTVISPQFERVLWFSGGLAPVAIGGREGYVDTSGKIAIKPQFEMAFTFKDAVARVALPTKSKAGDQQWGYIDKKGDFVIPAKFAGADDFREGMAKVNFREGKVLRNGYVDSSGNLVWREP